MEITLFDGQHHKKLLPLTFTKPVADLRVGIQTIREKWSFYSVGEVQVRTQDYLADLFKSNSKGGGIGVSASVLPTEELVFEISELGEKEILMKNGKVIAIHPFPSSTDNPQEFLADFKQIESEADFNSIEHSWDIFRLNEVEILADLERIKTYTRFENPSDTNTLIGNQFFIEKGAKVECATLNSTTGPIYVAAGAEIMEGAVIRGALALCKGAVVKLGTKIYGATTIGPFSKVGGEINNSVVQGYSNKGHDGFLGNSVIGEWCNLGADTNNSNLKNNYGEVKTWSYFDEKDINTGLQFCGLIMGDHSKSAINTMFNTGTVVGVNANIFGGDFPNKFIPSYSWGMEKGSEYDFDKSIEVAKKVCERRNVVLTQKHIDVLKHVFNETKKFRSK